MVERRAAGRQLGGQRRGPLEAHLVPADVRHPQPPGLQRRAPRRRSARARTSARRARSRSRTAAACRGRSRAAACRPRTRSRSSASRPNWRRLRHPARKRADAGQHERVGRARARRASRVMLGRGTDVLERLLDRAPVAHVVVDDRDARRAAPLMSACPWCSGRRPRSGRATTAARSARANALKIASITWWTLVPASTRDVQRQLGVGRDRAQELLGQLVVVVADRSRRQLGLEHQQATAGDVDRAGRRAPRPSARWRCRSA